MTKKERRSEFLKLKTKLEKDAFKWPHLSVGAKSAIAIEAMSGISSYVELGEVQESAGVPTVTRINARQVEHEAALDQFRLAIDLKDENDLRDEIARVTRAGNIRPLGFSRLRFSSGFLLLRHPQTNRVFAWLNLQPQKSRFASHRSVEEMVNVQTGEVVSFKSKTGALFPLEMGHSFHDLGFIQRGRPQSARLVWREQDAEDGGYFELHVAFQWETIAVQTDRWLGVDRGIYNLAAYSVVDDDGNVIHEGSVSGRDLRFVQRQFERRAARQQQRGHVVRGGQRAAWADEAVHVTANAIVRAAVEHGARVVLEDLSSLSAIGRKTRVIGRRRGGFNKLLNRKQYEKLRAVLDYKLREFGLPDALYVTAAGTSQTCPECAHWSADNRVKTPTQDGFQMDRFKCVACGHEADADHNASRVIALKGSWLKSLPKNPPRGADGKLADHLRFEAYLRRCAEKRARALAPKG
jgi:IS605 OrfB family transposase